MDVNERCTASQTICPARAIFAVMAATFHFHSDHPDPGTTRWLHVGFYFAAVLLLVAAVYEFYQYATHWTDGDDNSHLWQLLLGILYLIVAVGVAYATYRHGGSGEIPPERFVTVDNGVMTYELDQLNGRQRVPLEEVEAVHRPSVRDLILELRGEKRLVVPIYLIDDEEKQAELERILTEAAGRPS